MASQLNCLGGKKCRLNCCGGDNCWPNERNLSSKSRFEFNLSGWIVNF